jgi:hypothetical protein
VSAVQVHYRKLECITAKVAQNALAFYGEDITQLRGWADLEAADQATVREVFDGLINAAPAEKPKKEPKKAASKKKKAAADDDDDAAPAPKKKKAPPKKKAPAVAMPGDDD